MQWRGVVAHYAEYLPLPDGAEPITLLEGNTPLIPAPQLADHMGIDVEVFLKFEGLNPTGSFKDRGMTYAISQARAEGSEAVVCASTGNTSASAAAYARRAGMEAFVVIPRGKIALGKLAQAMIHGAKVIQIDGNFDQALDIVRGVADAHPVTLVNSLNPHRIEGQKTGSFEIVDTLGDAPDLHFLPVGNAGNITAYWKGYREYHDLGRTTKRPRMMGWQAAGAAPIVDGAPVENPDTVATAIRIGKPARWEEAVAARDESRGRIDKVTDDDILAAYRLLAAKVGVFCEPASAASVAGLLQAAADGDVESGQRIVCVLTGHGLKDPDLAIRIVDAPVTVAAELDAVVEAMELGS